MRRLAATVHLTDPTTGLPRAFVAGEVPPSWAAKQITNPAAWADDDVTPTPPAPTDHDAVARLRSAGVDNEGVNLFLAEFADLPVDERADAISRIVDADDKDLHELIAELAEDRQPPTPRVEPPAKNASKADWVTYATTHGGLSRDDAEALSRDQLAERFGNPT